MMDLTIFYLVALSTMLTGNPEKYTMSLNADEHEIIFEFSKENNTWNTVAFLDGQEMTDQKFPLFEIEKDDAYRFSDVSELIVISSMFKNIRLKPEKMEENKVYEIDFVSNGIYDNESPLLIEIQGGKLYISQEVGSFARYHDVYLEW